MNTGYGYIYSALIVIFSSYFSLINNFPVLKNKFITNLTLLIFLNLLIKPFWVLGIDLTVQNTVGADEYGFYFSLLSFSLLLNIIQDMGIASANNRNIARNHDRLSVLLPNLLVLKLFLALLYFAISLLIAWLIGYQYVHIKLLIVLLFNQFLNSMNLYLRSNIGGLQLFRTDSILSVTDRLLMIIICSFLLWGNFTSSEFKIEWFVYAQTAAYFLTTIITFIIVIKYTHIQRAGIDFRITRKLLKQSYPYAMLGFLMVLYYRTDSVMLERLLPDGKLQAGIYAQGFRILDAASMLGFLFAGILFPMFSKMIKRNDPVIQLFRFSYILLMIPAITASIGLNLYNFEIMDLLYKEHAGETANVFGILMISFVFISSSIISGTLLTANGNIARLNIIAVASLIMNIFLNIILIPDYQALGSAMASMITQFIASFLQILLIFKIFRFRPKTGTVLRFILFMVLLILTGLILSYVELKWYYGFLIIAGSGPLLAIGLKLLKIKEIKDSLLNS